MSKGFDSGNFFGRTFLCALLMIILAFSILPFSMLLIPREKSIENMSYTRVYTASSIEKSDSNASDGGSNSIKKLSQTSVSESVDFPVPTASASAINLGKVDTGVCVENFGFSDFGALGVPSSSADFDFAVFEIDALDKIPRRLRGDNIKYPREMLRKGIEGDVKLRVQICEDGSLEFESVISSTNPAFTEAAKSAVASFVYEIPTKNGKPVRARFELPIPFRIEK